MSKYASFLSGIVAIAVIAGCAATMPDPGTDQTILIRLTPTGDRD